MPCKLILKFNVFSVKSRYLLNISEISEVHNVRLVNFLRAGAAHIPKVVDGWCHALHWVQLVQYIELSNTI